MANIGLIIAGGSGAHMQQDIYNMLSREGGMDMPLFVNGIFELEKHYDSDEIVLIHDAIRTMVSA